MDRFVLVPTFLGSAVLAAFAGVLASAAMPALLFGGSVDDFVASAAPLALPALLLSLGCTPFLALSLQQEGTARFAWLCVVVSVLLIVFRELAWASAFRLGPTPALFWSAAFKALLRGVPAGIAAAAAALLFLRLCRRHGRPAA